MKYKFLFFDIDDTLWNCEANSIAAFLEIYSYYNITEISETNIHTFYQYYQDILSGLLLQYQKGEISKQELRVKRIEKSLVAFDVKKISLAEKISDDFIRLLPTKTQIFPAVNEVLDQLRGKGYDLNIISNGFDHLQKEKLRHSGLLSYFNKIITSERAGCAKPDKKIFALALKECGAILSQSLMIGDDIVNDVIGAQEFGMDQVYVHYDHGNSSTIDARYHVSSLNQLLKIL